MSIYTKKGDKGKTVLYGSRKVDKDNLCIEVCGSLDECSSWIGVLRSRTDIESCHCKMLLTIQQDLYIIMGMIAGATSQDLSHLRAHVTSFENEIDRLDKHLPPLHAFVLPGGTMSSAYVHVTRAVCRRAERHLVSLCKSDRIVEEGSLYIQYLNRLSDLLFIFGRWYVRGRDSIASHPRV